MGEGRSQGFFGGFLADFLGRRHRARSARAGSESLWTRIASNTLWGFAPLKRPRVSGARHSARLAVRVHDICALSTRERSARST